MTESKKILIITGDAGESFEVLYASHRLLEAGYQPVIAAPAVKRMNLVIHDFEPGWDTYVERKGYLVESDLSFDEVDVADYHCVLLPGGRAPEFLRNDRRVIQIVKSFYDSNKYVFAICHGVQILVTAGLVSGRKIACYEHVKFEVESCGGVYVSPDQAVQDGRIVTGKTWQSHPEFYQLVFACLEKAKAEEPQAVLNYPVNGYGTYSREDLDRQYNTRLQVPHFQEYLDSWESRSRETEQTLPVVSDLAYGSHPRERLDIYPAKTPGAKTLVFIHGGYWHLLDKRFFRFIASSFRRYGVTTVLLNYPQAPAATIDQIGASCRQALGWLYRQVANYGGDPHQLYLAGHSAGGHLAALLAATPWSEAADLPANLVKGACLVSGLFNLAPFPHTYLNAVLHLDAAMAARNSPAGMAPQTTGPLLVAVGEAETPVFQQQSLELYQNWKEKSGSITYLSLPGLHHYNVVDALADPDHRLHRAMVRLMELEAGMGDREW